MGAAVTYKFALIALSIAFVSAGQILFKYVSLLIGEHGSIYSFKVLAYTALAFVVSGLGSLVWIYLLRFATLSSVYPFMALSFVVVPLLSMLIYQDKLTAPYFAGISLIVLGIVFVTRGA